MKSCLLVLALLAQLPSPQPPTVGQPPSDTLPQPARPTPQQGVPSTRAVATVAMFWNQSAPTLATIQSYYTYAYYIDTASSSIPMTTTCADMNPVQLGLSQCSGPMTTLIVGTHTYTLEVTCASCADPKSAKSAPVSYTYSGGSTVQPPATIGIESGDGTNIPPQTQILDSVGATWTQSSQPPAACPAGVTGHPPTDCLDQLRNGTKIGLGSQIYYKNRNVYVYGPSGTTNHWWQYLNNPGCPSGTTASCWTDVGTSKPTTR